MTLHQTMIDMGDQAVAASRQLAALGTRRKNLILEAMADALDAARDRIKEANGRDMAAGRAAGLSDAMLDRLLLTDRRLEAMISGVRALIGLKDPVGQKISRWIRPNGLVIQKVRVPIGVIGIIFESRPNVAVDAAALCFKTSNAVILRGGKEALESNKALVEALQTGGSRKGLPPHSIQLITTTDHAAVRELVQLEGRVDLVIPRGGEALIRAVTEQAYVPVIKHYKGVCHAFVDAAADPDKALDIIENAKCSRPGVCNALEKVLVHEKIAAGFLPRLAARMAERRVELRGDEAARASVPAMKPAAPRGLGRRIPRSHPHHRRRPLAGGRHRAHQPPRLPSFRRHHHRGRKGPGRLPGAGGLRLRLCQRVDPLHRRRRIRHGRRNRHFHGQAPRPRPHGTRGTDHLQVRRARRRPDPALTPSKDRQAGEWSYLAVAIRRFFDPEYAKREQK